jgi:hypothetical protein
MNKIFGIGLNKTGTTTLAECLQVLGYQHTSYSLEFLKQFVLRQNMTEIFKVADKYDSFEDWPWPLMYQQLDKQYPGSKFILTERSSSQAWLTSLEKYSMRTPIIHHARKLAYGYSYPHKHRDYFLNFYKQHNQNVKEYFKHRPNHLLVVSWERGDGWKQLCTFLDKPIPGISFPHANPGEPRQTQWHRLAINHLLKVVLP